MSRLTGGRCECPTCLEQFGSVRAFDRHRTGFYASPGTFQHHRRCMTVSEMRAAGWGQNPKGQWLAPDGRRAGVAISGHGESGATPVAPRPENAPPARPQPQNGASQGA